MAVVTAKSGDHQAADLNLIAFKKLRELGTGLQVPWLSVNGHSIVANERISQHQALATVRGVSHRLGITNHPRVKHNLPGNRMSGTEMLARKTASVLEEEFSV